MTSFYEFPNGFRVVHQKPKNNLPITSIQCICDLGSVYENDHTRGSSHFIEHMCFKGTRKIPASEDIFKKYDEFGAVFNAFTEKRYTCYFSKCNDMYITNVLIILSDLLLNSVFNKKEYEKELQVVIQENINSHDRPADIIFDIIDRLIYAGSSYEYPVDDIMYHSPTNNGRKSFTYDDIIKIYHQFYKPSNFILSIVSNISFSHLMAILKRTDFVRARKGNKSSCKFEPLLDKNIHLTLQPQTMAQYMVYKKKGTEANHLAISFRTCSLYDEDKYPLEMLKTLIGVLHNSLLFNTLREKNGLTYTSYASTAYYENTGNFTFNAITDPSKLVRNGAKKGVLPLIIQIINNIIRRGITPAELKIVKQNMQAKAVLALENNDFPALYNAEYVLLYSKSPKHHEYISCEKYYDVHYKNISVKQINHVIEKYFRKSNMNVCVLGGKENVISEAILKRECEKVINL